MNEKKPTFPNEIDEKRLSGIEALADLIDNPIDLDPRIQEFIEENYWNLIDGSGNGEE